MTKVCFTCKQDIPISSFGVNKAKADGLAYECKPCSNSRLRNYRATETGRQVAKRFRQKRKGTKAEKDIRNRAVRRVGNRFRMNISVAARRGKTWKISLEEYKRLISQPCDYCGGPLPETAFGLDRLENSLGYTPSNVVPCCSLCNYARRDQFTPGEMKAFIGPAIRKLRHFRENPESLLEELVYGNVT